MKQSIVRVALSFFVLCLIPITAHTATSPKWTDLARKVGTSEDVRAQAIKELRNMKGLKGRLQKAIYTADRPLALDVISALDLKDLIPELLLHVPADPDGFLTVAVNSMMTEKNQAEILASYSASLEPKNLPKVSPGAVVAMLEPLGRLAIKLPRATLLGLKDHASPEVRSSTLYYLRINSLRNHVNENLDLVTELLKAKEFQIRLQAVSVTAELLDQNKSVVLGLLARSSLKDLCAAEKAQQIKEACLSFLANGEKK